LDARTKKVNRDPRVKPVLLQEAKRKNDIVEAKNIPQGGSPLRDSETSRPPPRKETDSTTAE